MFKTIVSKIRKSLVLGIAAAALAFGGAALMASSPAMAASKGKQVQFGLKFAGKTFQNLERAGRKAQQARGIAKPVGGILRGVGKAGRKGSEGLGKVVGGLGRGINKGLSKSKAGRALQNGYRGAQRFQNGVVDKAFRGCRGKACNFGKGAVKFLAPL